VAESTNNIIAKHVSGIILSTSIKLRTTHFTVCSKVVLCVPYTVLHDRIRILQREQYYYCSDLHAAVVHLHHNNNNKVHRTTAWYMVPTCSNIVVCTFFGGPGRISVHKYYWCYHHSDIIWQYNINIILNKIKHGYYIISAARSSHGCTYYSYY